nr:NADH dehydrogenase subunit 6 [Arichlidon gathofi]
MTIYMISSLIIMIGSSLMLMTAPISLGLWILLMSLFIAALIAFTHYSWFAFTIFLIYIGGMLVMFAYFAALQPNQQMTLKYTPLIIPLSFIMLFTLSPATMSNMLTVSTPITIMFSFINVPMLILMATVLFLALVAVVKISINLKSPLRPFL